MSKHPHGCFFVSPIMEGEDEANSVSAPTEGAQTEKEQQPSKSEPEGDKPEGEETETDVAGDEPDGEKADEGEEADDDDSDDEPEKPKSDAARRRERRERQRERESAELAALRSQVGSLPSDEAAFQQAVAAKVRQEIGDPPKAEDFPNDYLGWEREMAAYVADRRAVTRDVKKQFETSIRSSQAHHAELVEDHKERVAEFRKKVPEFDEVMSKRGNLKASPTVETLVLESDKSAHLVLYLAKNERKLNELNSMTEREAAREIGKIEARLSLPQPKTQTQARKPVQPLKGGAAPVSDTARVDSLMKKWYGDRA